MCARCCRPTVLNNSAALALFVTPLASPTPPRPSLQPQYSFLFGGEGYAFYLWVLYCCIWSIPWQTPPPGQAAPPAPAPAPHPMPAAYGMQPQGYPPQGAQYGYAQPVQAPPVHVPVPMPAPVVPQYQQPPPVMQQPHAGQPPVDHTLALPEELRVGFTSILGAAMRIAGHSLSSNPLSRCACVLAQSASPDPLFHGDPFRSATAKHEGEHRQRAGVGPFERGAQPRAGGAHGSAIASHTARTAPAARRCGCSALTAEPPLTHCTCGRIFFRVLCASP